MTNYIYISCYRSYYINTEFRSKLKYNSTTIDVNNQNQSEHVFIKICDCSHVLHVYNPIPH